MTCALGMSAGGGAIVAQGLRPLPERGAGALG
jgi:hypothetical protein